MNKVHQAACENADEFDRRRGGRILYPGMCYGATTQISAADLLWRKGNKMNVWKSKYLGAPEIYRNDVLVCVIDQDEVSDWIDRNNELADFMVAACNDRENRTCQESVLRGSEVRILRDERDNLKAANKELIAAGEALFENVMINYAHKYGEKGAREAFDRLRAAVKTAKQDKK